VLVPSAVGCHEDGQKAGVAFGLRHGCKVRMSYGDVDSAGSVYE
jgi:hypothetical protein